MRRPTTPRRVLKEKENTLFGYVNVEGLTVSDIIKVGQDGNRDHNVELFCQS